MKLIISGGVARKSNSIAGDWNSFGGGVLIVYDTDSCTVDSRFEYVTPIENKPSEFSSILFKSFDREGKHLFLTTKTEVLIYDMVAGEVDACISHPLMNDVHHISVTKDFLYVVSTGIDSVLVFNRSDFSLKDIIFVGDGAFQDKFCRNKDYRKIESLKPHECHPNYFFSFRNRSYVTRLKQRDCVDVESGRKYPICDNFIHDGVVFEDKVFFTSVDGRLIVSDFRSMNEIYDLKDCDESGVPLGWCRGVLPVDHGRAWVGFSVLRNTRFKENVKWAYSKLLNRKSYTSKRTRISLYNTFTREVEREVFLDDFGMDAVFRIMEA